MFPAVYQITQRFLRLAHSSNTHYCSRPAPGSREGILRVKNSIIEGLNYTIFIMASLMLVGCSSSRLSALRGSVRTNSRTSASSRYLINTVTYVSFVCDQFNNNVLYYVFSVS